MPSFTTKLGRISGQLLENNLVRDGVNLSFEGNLLFLDVVNARVGINNSYPEVDLDVNGTIKTNSLEATQKITIGDIAIQENSISTISNVLEFSTTGINNPSIIYNSPLQIANIKFDTDSILSVDNSTITISSASSINLECDTVNVLNDISILGSVTVDNNVVVKGDIILGDSSLDQLIINARIKSNLEPTITNTFTIGSDTNVWKSVYVNDIYTDSITNTSSITVGDITIANNTILNSVGDITIAGNTAVIIGNYKFDGSTITNVLDEVSIISQIGNGYVKFDGSSAIIIPTGTSVQRPTTPENAMIRYNTDWKEIEVYDANTSAWKGPARLTTDPTLAINHYEAQDMALIMSLLL